MSEKKMYPWQPLLMNKKCVEGKVATENPIYYIAIKRGYKTVVDRVFETLNVWIWLTLTCQLNYTCSMFIYSFSRLWNLQW